MTRSVHMPWLCVSLLLLGCDALFANNPGSCKYNPSLCAADEFCNAETTACEKKTCVEEPSQCTSTQYCDTAQRSCMATPCTIDRRVCSDSEVCNRDTRSCEARVFGAIGQKDLSTNENLRFGLNNPTGVHFVTLGANTYLLVADTTNHRVLIWKNVPTTNRAADVVLGQPGFSTNLANYAGTSSLTLSSPSSVAFDLQQRKLVVADTGANRMLIWNGMPTVNNAKPDLIWGQSYDGGAKANRGLALPTGNTLAEPYVAYSEPYLIVNDRSNNRVLLFPNGAPADAMVQPAVVLGQKDLVGDLTTIPIDNAHLSLPINASLSRVANGKRWLYVTDYSRHRVLAWSMSSTGMLANEAPADLVYGQIDFDRNNRTSSTRRGLSNPIGVLAVDDDLLLVADSGNDRIMGYTVPAVANGPDATSVIGQASLAAVVAQASEPTAATMDLPYGIAASTAHFAIADSRNHRVLLWNAPPKEVISKQLAPTVTLGQPIEITRTLCSQAQVNGRTLSVPRSITGYKDASGQHLIVADSEDNRVLFWDVVPGSPAEVTTRLVLGQSQSAATRRNAIPNGSFPYFFRPAGVATDGQRLAISDQGNNRVLLWKQLPTRYDTLPDLVLDGSGGKTTQLKFDTPSHLVIHEDRLYVADTGHHRILVWDLKLLEQSQPSTDPLLVIGQNTLADADARPGTTGLSSPVGLAAANGWLYATDYGNSRAVGFRLPIEQNAPASSLLLGESDFNDSSLERTSIYSIAGSRGIFASAERLYLTDTNNNRMLVFNTAVPTVGQPADAFFGQPNENAGVSLPNNDGPGHEGYISGATLNQPHAVYVTPAAIYVADTWNSRILVLSPWF